MLKADGLDDALIGSSYDVATHQQRLVYSVNKCIGILMARDGMSDVEAREYLEHNTMCAYVSQDQPIFVDAEYFDDIQDLYDGAD